MLSENYLKSFFQTDNIEEIKFLEAKKNYTKIYYISGNVILIAIHLKKLQAILNKYEQFIRIHRSYIVNKCFIKNIDEQAGFLKLVTNDVIPIGSNFAAF